MVRPQRLVDAVDQAKESDKALHILGLLSPGGVHSHEEHIHAMAELAEKPGLGELLVDLGKSLSDSDKEDIALMGLKVVAADGSRQFSEMEQFSRAMTAIGIAPEIVHRAFDRYFAETMPGQ